MPPTVVVDANVVISLMLLSGRRPNVIHGLFRANVLGLVDMMIGEDTISEVRSSIRSKPSLRKLEAIEETSLLYLRRTCGILPPVQPPMPRHCRDPRDDHLIAFVLACGATHLLTGDRDLLALEDGRFPFRVVTAADLAREIGIPEGG